MPNLRQFLRCRQPHPCGRVVACLVAGGLWLAAGGCVPVRTAPWSDSELASHAVRIEQDAAQEPGGLGTTQESFGAWQVRCRAEVAAGPTRCLLRARLTGAGGGDAWLLVMPHWNLMSVHGAGLEAASASLDSGAEIGARRCIVGASGRGLCAFDDAPAGLQVRALLTGQSLRVRLQTRGGAAEATVSLAGYPAAAGAYATHSRQQPLFQETPGGGGSM